MLALVSRSNMKATALLNLDRAEVANCAQHVELNLGHWNQKVLVVGTTYLDPEEALPSKGRLLILDETTLCLLQEFPFEGSIQAISFAYDNRYLIVGLNFTVMAF